MNILKSEAKIRSKLSRIYLVKEIEKVAKLPKGISFITWSLGYSVERDYRFKITCEDETGELRFIYCQLTTFFGLFILQSFFFLQTENDYVEIFP